ncbi:MAG: twin-arginine translocase subunit TatC [Flavobacteriales bacterium CG18_big_fil_WC_8_21_14_2_50_32_9]|nr:MAG: twin-arginine translocase subunit TatC [Flavobacteriales bacterium CG18_big_fil_WC_8_21_14_2_50_32_9]
MSKKESEEEKKEMSFLDHLEVLRWHLVRSTIAVMLFASLAFIYKSILFDDIILAQKNSNFWTYQLFCKFSNLIGKGDSLCLGDIKFSLINLTMSGQFTIHIMTSIIAGIVLAFPYLLFEIWRFIRPALEKKERKYATALIFSGSFLFSLGILFGYFFISPLSVQFLGNYVVSDLVENNISIQSFISTVTTITLACGLVFELPLLVYFLSKIGILTPEVMRKYRKIAIVATLILSAVITPPDVASQILLTVPLLILYEVSIFISKIVNSKS